MIIYLHKICPQSEFQKQTINRMHNLTLYTQVSAHTHTLCILLSLRFEGLLSMVKSTTFFILKCGRRNIKLLTMIIVANSFFFLTIYFFILYEFSW